MAEYIEREAAIKFVKEQMEEVNNKTAIIGSCVTATYDMAIRHAVAFLSYVPTAYPKADVVEVVRCRDCKHLSENRFFCKYYNIAIIDNGFCYRGTRMDGETE